MIDLVVQAGDWKYLVLLVVLLAVLSWVAIAYLEPDDRDV